MDTVLVADIIAHAANILQKKGLTSGIPYTFYPVNASRRNVQSSMGTDAMVRGFQHATMSGLPAAMVMPNTQQIIYYDPSVNLVRRYNLSTKIVHDIGPPYSEATGVYFGMTPIQPAAGFEGGRGRRRKTRGRGKKRRLHPGYTRVRKPKPLFL